jgi:hypothetical protein
MAFWRMPCRRRTVPTATRGTPFVCCPKSPLRASPRFPGWKAEGDLAYREKEKKKTRPACGDRLVVAGVTTQEIFEVLTLYRYAGHFGCRYLPCKHALWTTFSRRILLYILYKLTSN